MNGKIRMPIRIITKGDDSQVPKYFPPENKEIFDYFAKLTNLFNDYLKDNNIEYSQVNIDRSLIGEIIIRVDKRKEYFIIYHDETHICDVREVALLAYWFLKFKPFSTNIPIGKKTNVKINEGFAAFIILGVIKETKKRKGIDDFTISNEYLKKFIYALQYWDISKDAMMLVAETLCEAIK